MKAKTNFLLFSLMLTSFAFGQATLEHSYRTTYANPSYDDLSKIPFVFHTENGINYYTYDRLVNQLTFYNENHVMIRTVSLPDLPDNIFFVTDKLFNNDNLIEIVYHYTSGDLDSYVSNIKLINENGVVLQTFTNRTYARLIKNNTGNYKFLTGRVDSSESQEGHYMYDYDIYSLSGTLSIAQEEMYLKNSFAGFPNPASNKINITNPLSYGENQTLQVFDSNGKKIMEQPVFGDGKNIELNVSTIANGVYYIKLPTVKGIQTTKFIKE